MFNTHTHTHTNTHRTTHTHTRTLCSGHVSCDVCTFQGCNLIRNEDVPTETTVACNCLCVCLCVCVLNVCMCVCVLVFRLFWLPQCKNIQSISQIHQAISVKLVGPMIYGCQWFMLEFVTRPLLPCPISPTLAPHLPYRLSSEALLQLCCEISCISLIKQKGFDLSPSTVNDFNQLRLIRLTKTHRKTVNTLRQNVNE